LEAKKNEKEQGGREGKIGKQKEAAPSFELLFFGTSCVAQKRRRRSKCCLWSCTATLRILCSTTPQTNKQNKHKKKMLTWVLRGSGSSRSKLQACSHSKPAPSSKLIPAQRL
jgi:hypothetical protein